MSFTFFGIPISPGIAIGRAIVLASSSHDIDHYLIDPGDEAQELQRLMDARDAVVNDLQSLLRQIPEDTPAEVCTILEVHIMMLHDHMFFEGAARWINERHYNAQWALDTQSKAMIRQFNEMEDAYLRERRTDLEQITNRMQEKMASQDKPKALPPGLTASGSDPLIIVAHDIGPTDMLHFKQGTFKGFVTNAGGKTSHSAIVARSLGIPALAGTRNASHLIRQDDWVIIDGNAGVVIVAPTPLVLEEYEFRQKQLKVESEKLGLLRHKPAITLDDYPIELLANIELPTDSLKARDVGAAGIGLFRTEFLFMSHSAANQRKLPDEEEQYFAYKTAVQVMPNSPVTIRTIDVGADKPLDQDSNNTLNPALGLRAIRWSLAEPDIFLVQLRALLRAAIHGRLHVLFPMITHWAQIQQTLALLERAKKSLQAENIAFGQVKIGAMIEVPAAALILPVFLKYFDFLSIGTNDLTQYTLGIDRGDETIAHLFTPLHPAVLTLLASTIAQTHAAKKKVSVCGEMAGDPLMTKLLLGLGLRSFSMHPTQILTVKQVLLNCNVTRLAPLAHAVMNAMDPQEQQDALHALQKA